MERFIRWTILDPKTGNKIDGYKTKKLAEAACEYFKKCGAASEGVPPEFKNAWKAASERMKHPEGDLPLKPPRHSSKRRVELD